MHTLTIQPLAADGLPFDFPEQYQHADLFHALTDAHQKLRMARLAGAVIAVKCEGGAFEWLATYEDGEAGLFTVTDDDYYAAIRAHTEPRVCRLTGAVDETSDDCTTHTHEEDGPTPGAAPDHPEVPGTFGTCETPQYLDTLTCVCSSDTFHGGFANATKDAVEVDQDWDSRHVACRSCGRVYDQAQHDEATGRVPMVAGPQPFTPMPTV